jgi:hypothetical protein
VRYLRSTPYAIDVYDSLGRVRIGTKQNGIYARSEKDASASNVFAEGLHRLTVVQHNNVKLSENVQKVTMFEYLFYPELIQQTHRRPAGLHHIADGINH